MAEENSGMKHLAALVNARNKIAVWRNVSIFLGGIICIMAYALIGAIKAMPVVLVPHSYEADTGPMKVTSDIGENPQYLNYIAEADLQLYTTWTKNTVNVGYSRFLNRMGSGLYGAKAVELREEAKKVAESGYSQALVVTSRGVTRNNEVVITGTLTRWLGNEVVLQEPVTYRMSYQFQKGRLPMLVRFSGQGVKK